MTMTKQERQELRGVVRQQFKVLRSEVEQRRVELAAAAADRVRDRYAADDRAVDELNLQVAGIVEEANAKIREAVQAVSLSPEHTGQWAWTGAITPPTLRHRVEHRHALTHALTAGIDAQVHTALLKLDRQEADLLRRLALGALESEEARQFLSSIPTVGELVPSARLLELEQQWDAEQAGGSP